MCNRLTRSRIILIFITVLATSRSVAQTDFDAIMMNRKQICNGFTYDHSSWKEYWEGTMKRENENLGTVSMSSIMYMGAYGITDKLNIVAGLPYVWTKASAGTLHGLKGIQDASVFVKWKPIAQRIGKNKVSLFVLGGVSTPVSDYVIDYLPLSIGLGSTNLTARVMADYQRGRFTFTASGAYIWRSNVKIDRTSYYDTELHLTNEVEMPNAEQFQLRAGYRGRYLIAEALATKFVALEGFDITRNNMPFPSNRMKATMLGAYAKYTLPKMVELSFLGSVNTTISGRNMGKSTAFSVGAFYAFYFKGRKQSSSKK